MKRLKLALCLVLALCLMSGCAYLPLLAGQAAGLGGGTAAGLETAAPAEAAPAQDADQSDTVTISRAEYERYQQLYDLLEAQDLVDTYFYQDADKTAMLDGAIMGMLASLGDPYTFYYTAEEYAQMWADDEGKYAGVGLQISASYETGLCTISRVFEGTPAWKAGIHKGDVLTQVEDLAVTAAALTDAVNIMRGEPGTPVTVKVERAGEELTFTMDRADINVNYIDSMMLDDTIGYIYLYEFSGDCVTEFDTALKDLLEKGAKKIILDLRDNPGGWVNDAEKVADHFLDGGTICYLQYKDGTQEYDYATAGAEDVELTLLMNENSASSSEILVGALQDRLGVKVVGTQSYGKGIVQFVIPVGTSGAGMQVTAAQYFTPNGNAVHHIGITPDVVVELPEGDNGMYEFGDLSDPQLAKAYEVAKGE